MISEARKVYMKEYRKQHKDHIKAVARQYWVTHHDKALKWQRNHYRANADKINAANKLYRRTNGRDVAIRNKRRYYLANKEIILMKAQMRRIRRRFVTVLREIAYG